MAKCGWILGFALAAGCVGENPDFVEVPGSTGEGTTGSSTGGLPVDGSGAPDVTGATGQNDDTTAGVVMTDTGFESSTSTSASAESSSSDGGSGFESTSGSSDTDGNCVAEICDGLDNDCDDEIDEGLECSCVSGTVEPCYDGPAGTEGVGACAAGEQTCVDEMWGPCVGAVLPVAETCNGIDDDCDTGTDEDLGQTMCGVGICQVIVDACTDGQPTPCVPGDPEAETCDGFDENCDGQIDDGLVCLCLIGESEPCYGGPRGTEGVGECTMGVQFCLDGESYGECTSDVTPEPEACDGLDNDCDGDSDEDNPGGGGTCLYPAAGACSQGAFECVDAGYECQQVVFPTAEICDGIDNDCDTGTDEGNPGGGMTCPLGLQGPCGQGTTLCQSGSTTCMQTVFPAFESCDGVDNDCDGQTDEGNPDGGGSCSTGLTGACGTGTQSCSGGSLQCTQTVFPTTEVCDGADNDCDGSVDEGVGGGGLACNTGQLGVCSQGLSNCSGGMSTCVPQNTASPEVCDGLDNDCDGATDESNPGGGAACSTGLPGACNTGTTTCSGGSLQCTPSSSGSPETCDGLDNDCDGTTDEGNPGGGANCNTGSPGVCAAGTTSCTGGSLQCVANTSSSTETCDGLDNDCDGSVDESNPGGGMVCTTGLPGVCSAGTTTCNSPTLVCNQNTASSSEVCDGVDNDCDGTADEGGVCTPACAHPVCTAGVALTSGCDPCVTDVCAVDGFCCTTQWDTICVHRVGNVCGCGNCAFGCAHSLCATGGALANGCDNPNFGPNNGLQVDCVEDVCAVDGTCCSQGWDAICVGLVSSTCGLDCSCP